MNPAAWSTPSNQPPASRRGVSLAISDYGYAHPRQMLWFLLGPVLAWFVLLYAAPLAALLAQSAFSFDDFSMTVTHELTFANFAALWTDRANFDIVSRTFAMSLGVTLGCVLLGYPLAYYMARYCFGAWKGAMFIAVMLPMWASYIVKAYAWTVILAQEGMVNWFVQKLGLVSLLHALLALDWLGGNTLSTSHLGRLLVFTYMWLPFMILPIQASIERIAPNLLLASSDLGASPARTFWKVILPLSVPGVAAGSIFTFCLTFGDYIIPALFGPPGDFLGTAVYKYQGAIGNMPMAAALTVVPIVVVSVWLWLAKRLGAFDALG